MNRIALISDSSCDLNKFDLEKYSINLLPLRIIYENREFLDRIEISSEELLSSMERETPKTSLPDLDYSSALLEKLINDGYTHFIITTVSTAISGTFNSLRLLIDHYPNVKFHLFDTKTLGYPHGAINIEISKLISNNFSFDEIISRLDAIRTHCHGFLTCSTLEYLKRGGRIGKVSGTIAEALNIKPIISSNDEGELYTYSKARGRKQSISKLKDCITKYLDNCKCRVWILSGASDKEANSLSEIIKSHKNLIDISIEHMGASVLVHTGPGAIGACILEEF